MENWQQKVRQYIEACDLPRQVQDEVVAELAAHLEEIDEEARGNGMTSEAALELALQEVGDWRVLALEIARVKSQEDFMNYRTKTLWLPALATFFGASISLMGCQFLGMRPHLVWVIGVGMSFYWPWLATLPIFGAVGARLSQRAHGLAPARLAAALSPALVMLIVMLLILPFSLAAEGVHHLRLISFGIGLINWVAIPALALLVGALPFLHKTGPETWAALCGSR